VNNAAILVTDANAENELMDRALILINNKEKCKELANQIGKMELPHSDEIIANEVFKLAK
jgi:UDP-N-acetylglucosamine--N-acetylmuramyl-(pentapeptide) pyrophosphoryl-undecaprenol N-acetylglucosamine transferase